MKYDDLPRCIVSPIVTTLANPRFVHGGRSLHSPPGHGLSRGSEGRPKTGGIIIPELAMEVYSWENHL